MDVVNASYKKISGKYALEVIQKAMVTMLNVMIRKDNIGRGLYLLSLYSLKQTRKDFDELFPELKDVDKDYFLKMFYLEDE